MTIQLTIVLVIAASRVETGRVTPPALDQCRKIGIFLDTAWMLDVLPDGSGRIQYGSTVMDGGTFPKGTIDFRKLYRSLTPTLREKSEDRKGDTKRAAAVFFEPWGDRRHAAYTAEFGVIEPAFRSVLDAVDPYLVNRLEFLSLIADPFRPVELDRQWSRHLQLRADDCEHIAICTRKGWKLTIRADGSGEVSIGRHPDLTAAFGPKTFAFDRVYTMRVQEPLRAILESMHSKKTIPVESQSRMIVVGIKPRDKMTTLALPYVRDLVEVKALFERAWEAAVRPKHDPRLKKSRYAEALQVAWTQSPPIETGKAK